MLGTFVLAPHLCVPCSGRTPGRRRGGLEVLAVLVLQRDLAQAQAVAVARVDVADGVLVRGDEVRDAVRALGETDVLSSDHTAET